MDVPIEKLIKRIKSLKFHIAFIILIFLSYGVFTNYYLMEEKNEYLYNINAKSQSEINFNKNTGLYFLEMQISEKQKSLQRLNVFTLKAYYEALVQSLNYEKCFQPDENYLCVIENLGRSTDTQKYYNIQITSLENWSKNELVFFINKEIKFKSKLILDDFYRQFDKINISLYAGELTKPNNYQIEMSQNFNPFVYELDDSEKIFINPKKNFLEKLIVFFIVSILVSAIYVVGPVALRTLFK